MARTTISFHFSHSRFASAENAYETMQTSFDAGSLSHEQALERLFELQGNNPRGDKVNASYPSLSVGDVITIRSPEGVQRVLVCSIGFAPVDDNAWQRWQGMPSAERRLLSRPRPWGAS